MSPRFRGETRMSTASHMQAWLRLDQFVRSARGHGAHRGGQGHFRTSERGPEGGQDRQRPCHSASARHQITRPSPQSIRLMRTQTAPQACTEYVPTLKLATVCPRQPLRGGTCRARFKPAVTNLINPWLLYSDSSIGTTEEKAPVQNFHRETVPVL